MRPVESRTPIRRVERAITRLVGLATLGAALGGAAGLALWAALGPGDLGDWWKGTAVALVSLVMLSAPALWLINVRATLTSLLEMPGTLADVARRRRSRGSLVGAARDYFDVTGSWGLLVQLVSPGFWLVTVAAFLVVPLLLAAAAVVLVGRLLF